MSEATTHNRHAIMSASWLLPVSILRDWELLQMLNRMRPRSDDTPSAVATPTLAELETSERLGSALRMGLLPLGSEFERPLAVREALLLPAI